MLPLRGDQLYGEGLPRSRRCEAGKRPGPVDVVAAILGRPKRKPAPPIVIDMKIKIDGKWEVHKALIDSGSQLNVMSQLIAK